MVMQRIDVVCSTDDNYADYCAVMLCSVFENNTDLEIVVHILVDKLNISNQKKIKSIADKYGQYISFYQVDSNRLNGVKYRKNNPLSSAAYYRILLSSILPKQLEKVLYLDCDLIVLGNLKELISMDLTDYALAAVRDLENLPKNDEHRMQLNFGYRQPYFCSGVMLINLDFWRENHVENELIEFARRERNVYFHDQDALNYLFAHKWIELSPKWNRFNLVAYDKKFFSNFEDELEFIHNPKIVHFASPAKPWMNIFFINWRNTYTKYYEKCFEKKLERLPLKKNKLIIYKRIIETNLLNAIYHSPIVLGITALFLLNFLKAVTKTLMGGNPIKTKYFQIKNL